MLLLYWNISCIDCLLSEIQLTLWLRELVLLISFLHVSLFLKERRRDILCFHVILVELQLSLSGRLRSNYFSSKGIRANFHAREVNRNWVHFYSPQQQGRWRRRRNGKTSMKAAGIKMRYFREDVWADNTWNRSRQLTIRRRRSSHCRCCSLLEARRETRTWIVSHVFSLRK